MSEFAVPAGARPHGGFIALVVVGHISSHSLGDFKDTSGGHGCWERRLFISWEQMKAGLATEQSHPLLFADGHHQPPSPGCLCIVGGKVSFVDLPAGVDVGTLQHTNKRQLEREARNQASKRKK